MQAFREGRLREAADRLREAASQHERTVAQAMRYQTLSYLGATLYTLGLPVEAVEAFEQAVHFAVGAPPPELTINLANAYLAAGRPQDARRALQTALRDSPGDMEAQMLLQRLDNRPADEPVVGAVLGHSPQSVQNYLRTLSFAQAAAGGYDPAQVRQALAQISRYVEGLASLMSAQQETIARQEAALEQHRQMEETLVARLAASPPPPVPAADEDPSLSPIER
ncbi:MAG: tetratricopeptide repeat protein, partial [Acidobacteriota bacterium]|nr:tetratricopeptide repeat protein [Acidobacteriota bacterium]